MKTKQKENQKNEKVDPLAEGLIDLRVVDEEAEHAKGGPTLNFTKITYRQIEYDS